MFLKRQAGRQGKQKLGTEECGASFPTPFSVEKHKRMHGSEFLFPCKFRDARPLKETFKSKQEKDPITAKSVMQL